MSAFLVLVRMRVYDVTRSRASGALFMSLPVVLLALLALVFSNGQPFERRVVEIVGPPSARREAVVQKVVEYTELRVRVDDHRDRALARLRSRTANLVVVASPDGTLLVAGPNDRLLARGLAPALGPSAVVEIHELPRFGYIHYIFPGLVTSTTLLAGLFGMGYAMVRFRQSLFLKKLATTPLSRSTFVLALVAARGALILAQTAVLSVCATLLFGLPMTATSAALLLVYVVLGTLVFTGIGFLLACVVESEGVVMDVINACTAPLIFVSEMFFPNDVLPDAARRIVALLPTTMMVSGARAVLLYGETRPAEILPGILGLALWAGAAYLVSLRAFRWHG